jgi:hypothetical protein
MQPLPVWSTYYTYYNAAAVDVKQKSGVRFLRTASAGAKYDTKATGRLQDLNSVSL